MKLLRQLVGALLVLTIAAMLPAPLLACAQMGHRCAMMMASEQHEAMAMSGHDCCPHKAPAPKEKKPQCHRHMAMPMDLEMSARCCEMMQSQSSDATQMIGVKQAAPHAPTLGPIASSPPTARIVRRLASSSLYNKPVFELKTDLRI